MNEEINNNQDNEMIENNGLTEPENDPISVAKQIMQIESKMKEEISAIQEVLALLVSDKLSLDKIKSMTKEKLNNLANEQE